MSEERGIEKLPSIAEPLRMARKEFWRVGLFLGVNLFSGLLGVYVALLIPIYSDAHTLESQFLATLKSGAFYAFAITLLSSNVVFLLQGQSKRAFEHVRRWKISAVAIAFGLVLLIAIPAGMQAWADANKQVSSYSANFLQVLLTLLGMMVAIYCFLLAIYEEELDDFAATESVKVQELAEKSRTTADDGRGIQI